MRRTENKTYIIHRNYETLRVTVPASWKVTFGPGVPFSNPKNGCTSWALRFYEAKDKQRAIFTDVISFFDTSIKLEGLEKVDTQIVKDPNNRGDNALPVHDLGQSIFRT